jgi:hypothetical protein
VGVPYNIRVGLASGNVALTAAGALADEPGDRTVL